MAKKIVRYSASIWKTREDFERDLFLSYEISRVDSRKISAPIGVQVLGSKGKRKRIPKQVSETLLILDMLVLDAILWCNLFSDAVFKQRKFFKKQTSFARSLGALVKRVAQDSMVVRNLMLDGYDVQARSLLRSIDEHVDAIYYLCLRPEISDQFVHTIDDESANKFWYEHLRKARKYIDREIHAILKNEALAPFSVFRESERQMLSSAHHPSYAASTVPFMVPYKTINHHEYLSGLPSEHSYRTGRFLYYILAEMSLVMAFLNSDVKSLIQNKGRDPFQKFINRGQMHLLRMLMSLIKNWEAPVFDESKAMAAFVAELPE